MSSNTEKNIVSLKKQELSKYESDLIKKGLDLANEIQSINGECLQRSPVPNKEVQELLKYVQEKLDEAANQSYHCFEEAFYNLNKALQLDPNYAEVYLARATVRAKLGDYPGVIEDYTQILRINLTKEPLDSNVAPWNVYYSRASAHRELDDYKGAVEDYTQFLCLIEDYAQMHQISPFSYPKFRRALDSRGYFRIEIGDYQGAIEDYSQIVQAFSHHRREVKQALYKRGYARYKLGEHQGAIEDFNYYLDWDSAHGSSYYNRGNAYCELGEYQAAIDDYTQALKLDFQGGDDFMDSDHYTDCDIYVCRGNTYYKLGEYQSAIDDYTQSLQTVPENYYKWSRYQSSIHDYYYTLQTVRKNIDAYHGRSNARRALGDTRGALEDLKEALSLQNSL